MHTRRIVILALAFGLAATLGCRQVRQFQSRLAVDHYVKGQMLAGQGQLDAALVELAKAAKIDPDLSVVYSAMGDIHRNRGDYGPARVSYEKACEKNPYSFRPHYNLGVVYQSLAAVAGKAEEIVEYFRRAANVYLRAAALSPEDFDTQLNLSACYYSMAKYDLAEKYCKSAIALDPNRPEAHSNLGIIYDSQGQTYQAIKEYHISLELDTHQPKLMMNLGATYVKQGRLKSALNAFQMAAREDPNSPDAWEQLGTCQYHLKDYGQALQSYQKAIECDGSNAAAHRGLGVVYMTQFVLDRNKSDLRERALAAWHASLEINPNQKDIVELVRKYAVKPADPKL